MKTVTPAKKSSSRAGTDWIGWLPLVILIALAFLLRPSTPWIFMWMMAVAIFAGFKWWTWWRAVELGVSLNRFRSVAYLFLWPGMDAEKFLQPSRMVSKPTAKLWAFAAGKTIFGVVLLCWLARRAGNLWLAGWVGMVGLIFILHFGLFHLLSLLWQSCGIDAPPLMNSPISSKSLGEFWGKRWNSGFRDLAFDLLFVRLSSRFSPRLALLAVFLVSGVVHELVITVPPRAAYGLPTTYFMLQGVGMLFERSRFALKLGFRRTILGRCFAIAVMVLPIGFVFPKPFVVGIIAPFFQAIHALP